jgi:hypothetical protein
LLIIAVNNMFTLSLNVFLCFKCMWLIVSENVFIPCSNTYTVVSERGATQTYVVSSQYGLLCSFYVQNKNLSPDLAFVFKHGASCSYVEICRSGFFCGTSGPHDTLRWFHVIPKTTLAKTHHPLPSSSSSFFIFLLQTPLVLGFHMEPSH